jgi:hypothetical protein
MPSLSGISTAMAASATQEGSMAIGLLSRPMQRVPEESPAASFAEPAREATSIGLLVKRRIWERMARECEAMVQHALSTGRVVPAGVMERLDQAVSAPDALVAAAVPDRRDDAPGDAATGNASTIEMSRFVSLAVAHAGLALAIAPATPEAVRLMADERERHPVWSEFGPLPLVRQMLGLAVLSLLVLLGVSICAEVNAVNMSKSLLELAGYPLFMIEAFLVSAASLGACFANLQKINAVISDGTYDPRVQSTYWTRWVMGVISGIVLSQIVYDFFLHSGNDTTVQAVPSAIGQPLLALLGGYSVDFVHGILKRAINTLGNFFGVSADGAADNQQRAGAVETIAPQALARASALVGREQTPAASPGIEELSKGLAELTQRVSPKTN